VGLIGWIAIATLLIPGSRHKSGDKKTRTGGAQPMRRLPTLSVPPKITERSADSLELNSDEAVDTSSVTTSILDRLSELSSEAYYVSEVDRAIAQALLDGNEVRILETATKAMLRGVKHPQLWSRILPVAVDARDTRLMDFGFHALKNLDDLEPETIEHLVYAGLLSGNERAVPGFAKHVEKSNRDLGAWIGLKCAWSRLQPETMQANVNNLEDKGALTLLAKADIAFLRNNVSEAIDLYRQLLASEPLLTPPRARLVFLLLARRRLGEAKEEGEHFAYLGDTEKTLRSAATNRFLWARQFAFNRDSLLKDLRSQIAEFGRLI